MNAGLGANGASSDDDTAVGFTVRRFGSRLKDFLCQEDNAEFFPKTPAASPEPALNRSPRTEPLMLFVRK